jgi:hypothetical protein
MIIDIIGNKSEPVQHSDVDKIQVEFIGERLFYIIRFRGIQETLRIPVKNGYDDFTTVTIWND